MIIAIDGPSGTGKSTVAKELAKRLGFSFFDTGAMYRSFAWKVLQSKIDPLNEEEVLKLIPSFSFEVRSSRQEKTYFVDGTDVTEAIRSREVTSISSQVATYVAVRKCMVKMQRHFGRSHDAVFEGRDMGTVVFPKADVKIFLTASERVRAERRFEELKRKFPEKKQDFDQVLKEMQERDKNDQNRETSPLKQADDAVLIDTSNYTADEVVAQILVKTPKRKKRLLEMKLPYFLVYWTARIFFRLFFRLKIYGEKHIYPGAGLLIANHTSFYDPPVLSISCPEEVHFLARETLFRIPLLGRLIKVLNTHPLAKGASDMNILRQMIKLLNEGNKLIIFPEGTRARDEDMQPFKKGFVFLAKKAKCTIFPAYIKGAQAAWPAKSKFPKIFGKISCVFGSPIEWEDFEDLPKGEIDDAIAARCSTAIKELKTWLHEGAKGNPP